MLKIGSLLIPSNGSMPERFPFLSFEERQNTVRDGSFFGTTLDMFKVIINYVVSCLQERMASMTQFDSNYYQ